MSLPFRITFNDTDFVFFVLTKGINKHTSEITIAIDGKEFELKKNPSSGWMPVEESPDIQKDLLAAIGRAIRLRFRI